MGDAFKTVQIVRVRAGRRDAAVDRAAAEEPLEVRLHGEPFAVIMRTPGADRELAAGFLFAERVLASADDLGAIAHCTDPGADHPENVLNVTLAGPAHARLERTLSERRMVTVNASCGMCGRLTIDSLRTAAPALASTWTVSGAAIAAMPDQLRGAQAVFDETGGLHAAGLFRRDGALEHAAEDVGRHNAVDKVVGRMVMLDALPLSDRMLFVTGRTSFEIVQKAFLAAIPIVASVSAPSSLAIALAAEIGVTLIGFVRGDGFNIYAHGARVI
jgi:FdhD protein